MIVIKEYSIAEKHNWDNFCNTSKTPLFMFNRDFMGYHKDRFFDNSLMFYYNDDLIALLPANKIDNMLLSHGGLTYGGFIVAHTMQQHIMNDCFAALQVYLKEHSLECLRYKAIPHIYHIQPAEEYLYALYRNDANIIKIEPATIVNLEAPLKMPKGRKAQIGRAKREGVEIQETCDFETFIELENTVLAERHGVQAVHTAAELQLLNSYFPHNIKLFAAYYANEMIAGVLVFEYKTVVHTQYMAASEKAREIGALDLIVSSIIEKYKTQKKYLDFGISSEQNGAILNEGLIAQKEGFGGRTNVYITWEMCCKCDC